LLKCAPKLFCHVEKKTTAFCHTLAKNFSKTGQFQQNEILLRTAQSVLEVRCWILVGNLGDSRNWIVGISVWLIADRFFKTGKPDLSVEEQHDARACSVCPRIRTTSRREEGGRWSMRLDGVKARAVRLNLCQSANLATQVGTARCAVRVHLG